MSETLWNGIRVALDQLEASGADPTALADVLVLFGMSSGARAMGDVTRAMSPCGWEPPYTADDLARWQANKDGPAVMNRYLRKPSKQLEARVHERNEHSRGMHMRLRADWTYRADDSDDSTPTGWPTMFGGAP